MKLLCFLQALSFNVVVHFSLVSLENFSFCFMKSYYSSSATLFAIGTNICTVMENETYGSQLEI